MLNRNQVTRAAFKRSLQHDLVARLNELAEHEGSWWHKVVNDKDAYIAIRDGYLNVYVYGGALLKVSWDTDIACSIHHKYLTVPENESRYVTLDRDSSDSVAVIHTTREFAENYEGVKRQIKLYSHAERAGVGVLASTQPWVIDVEIAFASHHENADDSEAEPRGADRVDFVAIHPTLGRVAFCEAKLYTNGELRSTTKPKVAQQLSAYRRLLANEDKARQISSAYSAVAKLYRQMTGQFFETRRQFLESLPETIHVETDPRLVIFSFDDVQKKHELRPLTARLMTQCGIDKRNIIARGDISGIHLQKIFWR
jgi:hypothetical protein